ncbi:protein CELLULOSE SYNTHASE INTERACTIVE 1 [Lactuca sativa]|uniref:protein CELLULOSE SYNTHASE INTERACTIVE 1 n=1 Tax=Lactuca sativa TaxID=4236 RepID=UPI000CD97183|nr:protein CELLULOSE SYNTHASE INTERACTIVE 1 [Lactuca sativa]
MKVVAICALQNLVMHSRSNKRAVAEAGGVQLVLDLIGSGDMDTSIQAAMFIKLLFSKHTIQEYASSETVRAITAVIEKDLWATGTVHEEHLLALNTLFRNFPRLRAFEPATFSIPQLVTSLKTGSEATQEAALDALFLLRLAWSACPADVSRSQSNLRIIFTPYETTEVTLPSFLLATSFPKKIYKKWLLDGLAGLSTKHGHLCFYGNCVVVCNADDSSATALSSSHASKALYEIMRLLLFYLMDFIS